MLAPLPEQLNIKIHIKECVYLNVPSHTLYVAQHGIEEPTHP